MFKIAACVAALLPCTTFAQGSVTMYGTIDTGIQYLTNVDATGNHSIGMAANAYLPSRLGFRGVEDLGGGLNAEFALENGFNSTNGALSTVDTLFNRQAWIGLSNNLGKITFGRQYSVLFDKSIYNDPTYFADYSALSLNAIPVATSRTNNSIKIQSQEFSGLSGEAMYGFGQQVPGNTVAGRYIGAGLQYHVGAFTVDSVYEQSRGTVTDTADQSGLVDTRYSFGMRYISSNFSLMANVTRVAGDLQLTPRGTVYWGGGNVFVTPTVELYGIVGRYDYQSRGEHPMLFVAGSLYLLSKATFLYASVGTFVNNETSAFGLNNYASVGQPGRNQFGVAFGIDHKF